MSDGQRKSILKIQGILFLQPCSSPSIVLCLWTINNAFKHINHHTDTSAITITTTTKRIKQPHRRLVPESKNTKKKSKTQKLIKVSFTTTAEKSPPLETFADLPVPHKARKNKNPQKGCGLCGIKEKGEQVKNCPPKWSYFKWKEENMRFGSTKQVLMISSK